MVGEPRHELDHASGGDGRQPGVDFMYCPVRAFSLLVERLAIEHDPEKHALGLDPRVGTGFPSGQTRSVCPEIMLKQKEQSGMTIR